MPIPDYEAIMLPLLRAVEDGREHSSKEVRERVARHFHLSGDELRIRQPSGMSVFTNRFHWARLYLGKAKLIETPRRGWYRISPRGKAVLTEHPAGVSKMELMRFPELAQFVARAPHEYDRIAPALQNTPTTSQPHFGDAKTPDENLVAAYWTLRRAVEAELLEKVLAAEPQFFEELVVKLLVAMGYGGSVEDAGQVIGRSGDGGLDGQIKEDQLGLDVIHIQAKRWKGTVGAREIRDFAGGLDGEQVRKGIFITTSSYSNDAKDYVRKSPKRIVLIDGETLARLMFDHGIGVTTTATYNLKRVDLDFFAEDE